MNCMCVYEIKNNANGKIYIGSTTNFLRRKYAHISNLRGNKHNNPHLQNAWNKYGEKSFAFLVIDSHHDNEKLRELEFVWINNLKSNIPEFGYNMQGKISGKYVVSAETRRKLSECNKGKKRSPETVRRITAALYARPPVSSETRRKHSERQVGDKNHNYGKARDEKTRAKIKQSNTVFSVLQCDLNDKVLRIFINANEAAKELGISFQNIYAVCRNKRLTAGGFKWRYCEKT